MAISTDNITYDNIPPQSPYSIFDAVPPVTLNLMQQGEKIQEEFDNAPLVDDPGNLVAVAEQLPKPLFDFRSDDIGKRLQRQRFTEMMAGEDLRIDYAATGINPYDPDGPAYDTGNAFQHFMGLNNYDMFELGQQGRRMMGKAARDVGLPMLAMVAALERSIQNASSPIEFDEDGRLKPQEKVDIEDTVTGKIYVELSKALKEDLTEDGKLRPADPQDFGAKAITSVLNVGQGAANLGFVLAKWYLLFPVAFGEHMSHYHLEQVIEMQEAGMSEEDAHAKATFRTLTLGTLLAAFPSIIRGPMARGLGYAKALPWFRNAIDRGSTALAANIGSRNAATATAEAVATVTEKEAVRGLVGAGASVTGRAALAAGAESIISDAGVAAYDLAMHGATEEQIRLDKAGYQAAAFGGMSLLLYGIGARSAFKQSRALYRESVDRFKDEARRLAATDPANPGATGELAPMIGGGSAKSADPKILGVAQREGLILARDRVVIEHLAITKTGTEAQLNQMIARIDQMLVAPTYQGAAGKRLTLTEAQRREMIALRDLFIGARNQRFPGSPKGRNPIAEGNKYRYPTGPRALDPGQQAVVAAIRDAEIRPIHTGAAPVPRPPADATPAQMAAYHHSLMLRAAASGQLYMSPDEPTLFDEVPDDPKKPEGSDTPAEQPEAPEGMLFESRTDDQIRAAESLIAGKIPGSGFNQKAEADPEYIKSPEAIRDHVQDMESGAVDDTITDPKYALDSVLRESRMDSYSTIGKNTFVFGTSNEGMKNTGYALRDREEMQVLVSEYNNLYAFANAVNTGTPADAVFQDFAPDHIKRKVNEFLATHGRKPSQFVNPGVMFYPFKQSPIAEKVTHPRTVANFGQNIQTFVDDFAQRSFEKILPILQEISGTTGTNDWQRQVYLTRGVVNSLVQSLGLGKAGSFEKVSRALYEMGFLGRWSATDGIVGDNIVLTDGYGKNAREIPFSDLRDMLLYRMTPKNRRTEFVDAKTKEFIPFADTFASNLISRRDGSVTLDNVFSIAGLLQNAKRKGGDAGRTRMYGPNSSWQLVVDGSQLNNGEVFTAMEGAVEVEVVQLTEAKLTELGYSNVKPDANGNVLLVNLEAGNAEPIFVEVPEAFMVDGARDSQGVVPILKIDRYQLGKMRELINYVQTFIESGNLERETVDTLRKSLGKLDWYKPFHSKSYWGSYPDGYDPRLTSALESDKTARDNDIEGLRRYLELVENMIDRRLAGKNAELPVGELYEGARDATASLARVDGARYRHNSRPEQEWHERALNSLSPFTEAGELQIGRDTKRIVRRVTGQARSQTERDAYRQLTDSLRAAEQLTRNAFRAGVQEGKQKRQPEIDRLREREGTRRGREEQRRTIIAQGRLAILYGGRIDPNTGEIVVRPQVLAAIQKGLLAGPEQLEATALAGEDTDTASLFEEAEGAVARTELEKLEEAERLRDEGLGTPVSPTGQETNLRAKIFAASGIANAKTPEAAKTAVIEALRKVEIAEADYAFNELLSEEKNLQREMTPEIREEYNDLFGPGGKFGGEEGLSFVPRSEKLAQQMQEVLQLAAEGAEIPETVLISYRQKLENQNYGNLHDMRLSGKETYEDMMEVDPYGYYNELREAIRELRIKASQTTAARESERANKIDAMVSNLVADIEAGLATGQFKGTEVGTGTGLLKQLRDAGSLLKRDPKQFYTFFMSRYPSLVQYLTGSRDSALYRFLVLEINASQSYANAVMVSHGERTNEIRRAIGLSEQQVGQAGKAGTSGIFDFGKDYKVQISGRPEAEGGERVDLDLTFGELAHLALLMKDPDNFARLFIKGDLFRARRGGNSIRLDLETVGEVYAALDKFDVDMGLNTQIAPDGEYGHLAGEGGIRRLIDEAFAALNYGEFKELRRRFHDTARINLPNSSEKSNLGVIPNDGEPYVPRRRGVDKAGPDADIQNVRDLADQLVGTREGSAGALSAVASREDVLGARAAGDVEYPIVVENFFTDFARQVQQIAATYAMAPHIQMWSEIMANEAVASTVRESTAALFWDQISESMKLSMLEMAAVPLHTTSGGLGMLNRVVLGAIRFTTALALNPINAPAVTAYQFLSVGPGSSYYSPEIQNHPMIRPVTGGAAKLGVTLTGDSSFGYFLQQSIGWMRNSVESAGVGVQQTFSQLVLGRHFAEGSSPVLNSGQRMFRANINMRVRGDRTATTMFTEMNLGDVSTRAAGGDEEAKGRVANVLVRLGTIQGVDHMAVSQLNLMSEIEVMNDWIRWYGEKQIALETGGPMPKAVDIHGQDVSAQYESTEAVLREMGIDPGSANPFMDPAAKNTFIGGFETLALYEVVNAKTNYVVQMTQPMSNILNANWLRRTARKFPAAAGVEAMFQTASSALAGNTVEERILSRQLDRLPQFEEEKLKVFMRLAQQQIEREVELFRRDGASDAEIEQYIDDQNVEELAREMMQRGKQAGSEEASGTGFHGENNSTKGTTKSVIQQLSTLASISTLGAITLYLKGDIDTLDPREIGINTLRKLLQTNFPVLASMLETAYGQIQGKPSPQKSTPIGMMQEDILAAVAAVLDLQDKASSEEKMLALTELGMLGLHIALPVTRGVSTPGYLGLRELREAEEDQRKREQRFGRPLEIK